MSPACSEEKGNKTESKFDACFDILLGEYVIVPKSYSFLYMVGSVINLHDISSSFFA